MTATATARCNYLTAIKATDVHGNQLEDQRDRVARLQYELHQATLALDEMELEHLALLEAEEECRKAAHVTYKCAGQVTS